PSGSRASNLWRRWSAGKWSTTLCHGDRWQSTRYEPARILHQPRRLRTAHAGGVGRLRHLGQPLSRFPREEPHTQSTIIITHCSTLMMEIVYQPAPNALISDTLAASFCPVS